MPESAHTVSWISELGEVVRFPAREEVSTTVYEDEFEFSLLLFELFTKLLELLAVLPELLLPVLRELLPELPLLGMLRHPRAM